MARTIRPGADGVDAARRRLLKLGAASAASRLAPAWAAPAASGPVLRRSHGLAMHGEPALPADFTHLPYVNPDAPKGGRLSLGFSGTFDGLNPYNARAGSAAQGLAGNVFQTLMARSLDEPFTLYGLLAQSVEVDDERTTVVFHIDPRAQFADGSPVTAKDVLFTFELLKTRGRPQQRKAFELVREAVMLDERAVRYDLTGVDDREMPLTLALMPVLSQARTNLDRFDQSTLDAPFGSGPYAVAAIEPGEKIVLRRNPDYWGRDLPMGRGLHNFDEIAISYYRDANSMFESFKAGLIDYREETSPSRWIGGYDFPAVREGRVVREQLPLGVPLGLAGFAFNTRRSLFQDIRVREAIASMFEFEWVNASFFAGLFTRTASFFDHSELASTGKPATAQERALLQAFPDAVRPDIMEGQWRPYPDDGSGRDRKQAAAALDLLSAAGWTLQKGVLTKDGAPLRFEIMVSDLGMERLALQYKTTLRRIGVIADVRNVDSVQYQRRRQKFDFDMMPGLWAASASPGNEQRGRWGAGSAESEGSFNLAGASSPAIDALIRAMLAARSREDFATAVRAYDRVLLSGFYVVPLYHSTQQWDAWWTRLARPPALPKWTGSLFGSTLDAWWRKPT